MPSNVEIYIVDDEPTVCTAYARLMRSANLNARVFNSVEALLNYDFPVGPSCIISDIRMPGMSGLELPARLKQAGHPIPVILITAHDTLETRDIAQRAGVSAYFRKPVDDQALLDAIAWAVSGQQSRQHT